MLIYARQPFWPYLKWWLELDNDCTIHPIPHRRALLTIIRDWRCNVRLWSQVSYEREANFGLVVGPPPETNLVGLILIAGQSPPGIGYRTTLV